MEANTPVNYIKQIIYPQYYYLITHSSGNIWEKEMSKYLRLEWKDWCKHEMNDSFKLKHMLEIFMLNHIYSRKKKITKKENGASLKKNPRNNRRKANQKRFYKIVYYTYMYEY